MKKTSIWDTEKLDKLKKLWEKGVPITKIGDELGVSRNAIAGKAHRLGLPKRNSPISSEGEERRTKSGGQPARRPTQTRECKNANNNA